MKTPISEMFFESAYQAGDHPAVLALVRDRAAGDRLDYPGLDDIRELLDVFKNGECIRLWKDQAGSLAGYAILNCGETYASLVFEVAREFPLSVLGERILAWAEETYRRIYSGQAAGIGMSVPAHQAERLALLERSGYVRQPEEVLHLVRSLLEPIPLPVLPEGFAIRSLAGEAEAPAWVALHQAAFGTHNMTLDYKLAMLRLPDYDPALDLVATAPDGSLAAYVLCSYNREENTLSGQKIGYTDPVGTHPAYQRKGLCRALLFKGMTLLKERGMLQASLGTSSETTAMQRAAQSAGYIVADRSLFFQKELQSQVRG